jgi:hypothetical protein
MCLGGGGAGNKILPTAPVQEKAPELLIDAASAKERDRRGKKKALASGRDSLIITPGLSIGSASRSAGSGVQS